MTRDELMGCFADTMNFVSGNTEVNQNTAASISATFVSGNGAVPTPKMLDKKCDTKIIVEKDTTFAAAKRYKQFGKVAVLNFANAQIPGGGVVNGAIAQEECLCRSSNLYPCLTSANAGYYYNLHNSNPNPFYSDTCIYSPDVLVFKNDFDVPQYMPVNEWFKVDVITSAAPNVKLLGQVDPNMLYQVIRNRIRVIVSLAINSAVEVLVLGAFGCGAFGNSPDMVAAAFKEVLEDKDFKNRIPYVVFAIKGGDSRGETNFEVFSNTFGSTGLMRYWGKNFAFVGDSITTFEGFNPAGYKIYYSRSNQAETGVTTVNDTWWGKMIEFFKSGMLANNSWSGSLVTKEAGNDSLFPSSCSDERTYSFGMNMMKPDVVVIYVGVNDCAFGAKLYAPKADAQSITDYEYFDYAYRSMIRKIKLSNPNAEIWCCTIGNTKIYNAANALSNTADSDKAAEYNSIIRGVAYTEECKIIDIAKSEKAYETIDGVHPDRAGMSTLCSMMIEAVMNDDRITISEEEKANANVLVGKTVADKYKIEAYLGADELCNVYMAKKTDSMDRVLLKTLCEAANQNKTIRNAVIKSADLAAQEKIPYICNTVGALETSEGFFIESEYIEGISLKNLIANFGVMSSAQTAVIMMKTANLLGEIFAKHHITHNDISEDNILIGNDGNIYLTGFNPAKLYKEQFTLDTTAAPNAFGVSLHEQYGVRQVAVKADIEKIGLTTLYMLTGYKYLSPEATGIKKTMKLVPKKLERIITKCIFKDPGNEYHNYKELEAEFRDSLN